MRLDDAIARLAQADVPLGVMYVIERLQAKGFQAVLVGGCVRDILLQRELKDWDLATSARPEEVQASFKKTIPTGIEHGTVTVLPPKGPKTPIEITTFRGDEGYQDGRHPDAVRFLTNLDEDLARRDFTINAMAYDPVRREFCDPFKGLADLAAKKVRAVGTAQVRFEEDGLRTMRALRFAATLKFQLEDETARALAPCVDILRKVSRERVRVELSKMLAAARPGDSLRWMWSSKIWDVVLGEQGRPVDESALEAKIHDIEALPCEPWYLRLAGLLSGLRDDKAQLRRIVDDLRPSRQERRAVLAWLGPASMQLQAAGQDPVALRRAHVALTPEFSPGALALAQWDQAQRACFDRAIQGAPDSLAQLEITAKDLIAHEVLAPGPQLGACMRELLDWVLQEPTRNERSRLLEKAKELAP